ncbi:hypothetical protein Sjap_002488 [Stephania japonica]|uniref:Uncharacterized protein n=1 Tax=Stephania japonica TaxID=461633 RepID=A0AAP0KM05_9MAGN
MRNGDGCYWSHNCYGAEVAPHLHLASTSTLPSTSLSSPFKPNLTPTLPSTSLPLTLSLSLSDLLLLCSLSLIFSFSAL